MQELNFTIQVSDDFPSIENIKNLNEGKTISPDHLDKVLLSLTGNPITFVTNEEWLSAFEGQQTIGDIPGCSISIITDDNIDNFANTPLQDVYLFIKDENKVYENFTKIAKNVSGSIEFKTSTIVNYNLDLLGPQVGKIAEDLKTTPVIVKQLNGFLIKEKFNDYGNTRFFIAPDELVYPHPSLYYQHGPGGMDLLQFLDSEYDDRRIHFTKPHLICLSCETFYCRRNIFYNKMITSEYKAPASQECAEATFFARYSKKLFNEAIQQVFENPEANLDTVSGYDSAKVYNRYFRNEVVCNGIKGIINGSL